MRHRKHQGRLGRASGPRRALLRNLVGALILNEKVRTTQARATELRRVGEQIITLARDGSQAARRRAFGFLQQKNVVHHLFEEIGPRFADRPGGYLRIVKDGPRPGDGAMMAYVELVDREIVIISEEEAEKKKSRAQRLREMRSAVRQR